MSQSSRSFQQEYLLRLKQEILDACKDELFEVHHGPPPFWNPTLDSRLQEYLSHKELLSYSTCPLCHHKVTGAKYADDFNDPWWLYPQKSFNDAEICSHFEGLSYSILWNQSEPIAPSWLIPCGWGVPAISEALSQNDNLAMTIKIKALTNGAIIFWMGFYRKYPGIPLYNDFWPIPILKLRNSAKSSVLNKGYWGGYAPLNIHNPIVWSKLYLEQTSGELKNYETDKDADFWFRKIQHWQSLAYTQPMKMHRDRMVTEAGITSFALGMKASRAKGALFISQAPIFNPINAEKLPLSLLANDKKEPQQSIIQPISVSQMKAFAQTNTLWAIVDPFQNECMQEWIRLIKKNDTNPSPILPLWRESELKGGWQLTADLSRPESLKSEALETLFRDQAPVLMQITPEALELSFRYGLVQQAWGAFFLSEFSAAEIHYQLRDMLVAHLQNQWVYFRFYDASFLTIALSTLNGTNLNYFYKMISAWILCNVNESKYTLYTNSTPRKKYDIEDCAFPKFFPAKIYEAAQTSYQMDLPRRIHEFIKEKTPEFSDLIPDPILDRWIRESIRQSYQWGIKKEAHITKVFLWKIFITPTWCHISPFTKVLQQKTAEELKIQSIENLLPQMKLSELPRNLCIESWDAELWNELRKINSPLVNADPQTFHPILGDPPPLMPLNNPKWVKILGEFYQAAYADLFTQSGFAINSATIVPSLQRPTHAPPRIHSISFTQLAIRDDGTRTHTWLQQSGFERLNNSKDYWFIKSASAEQIAYIARKFLEEFPYIESKNTLDPIGQDLSHIITNGLTLFTIHHDEHYFWYLKSYK